MTDRELVERLASLQPQIINVLGFHDLIDVGAAQTPLQAMSHQIHLTAAAVTIARELQQIVDELCRGG